MVTQSEILALNRTVEVPLLLGFLGADPKQIRQIGRKPDYRCPAFWRGGDNLNGLGVTFNGERGKWICTDFTGHSFSNIDLIDFSTKFVGKSFRETIDLMVFCSGKDNGYGQDIPSNFEPEPPLTEPKIMDLNILDTYNKGIHPYWQNKGFTPDTAMRFKLGWSNYGELKDRLTIPVFNEWGDLVAVQGRTMDDRIEPKYRFLQGTGESAKLTLYNYEDAVMSAKKRGWLGVVEGAKSVWRAHQYNYHNFVATLSTSVTERQIELMMKAQCNIVIMFDFDASETMSGQIATLKLANQLKDRGHKNIYICNIGFHAGPDDLSIDQFTMTLKNGRKFNV